MRAAAPLAAALALALPTLPLAGQDATVAVEEENFRAEPGGEIVARLFQGTALTLGEARDRWRQATLEAWIWNGSVGPYGRMVLVNAGGENLRDAPNGRRLGRAEGGMQLEPIERSGDWLHVRRTAWVWAPSIEIAAAPSAASAAPTPVRAATRAEPSERPFESVPQGGVLRDRVAGDSVARLRPGADVEVLDREGDWTRVRVEGWILTADLGPEGREGGTVLVDLSRDSLQSDPGRYRGRIVEWTVQFISLQEAEAFRTDFLEGEPFILARGPGDDDGFVYVAVPAEQLDAVESIDPLQSLRILARIRSVRSALTGAPVVDLLQILR